MPTFYLPDLLYHDNRFHSDLGLLVDDEGIIREITPAAPGGATIIRFAGRAILPGLVNAHSHTFQRLIRGVAEHCGPNGDDFWAWRNTMYHAADSLSPDDLFDVARMAFLEMVLSGITAVGEFHYVHRQPDGSPYPDPNLLAKRVIEAARSVGVRICLLRVAYERAGFNLAPNPGQRRFYETCDEFLEAITALASETETTPLVTIGAAPHSIRAVSLASLRRIAAWAAAQPCPLHIHVAEQPAELAASQAEYGFNPIALLAENSILTARTTLVHAIHNTPSEVAAIAASGATICSCPTTERNLGDGIIDAATAIAQRIPFSFGSDSQATINLLEDARELDYHLRLERRRRVVLDRIDGEDISTRLFRYATLGGAHSLGLDTGTLAPNRPADFFTIDLNDVSIAGSSIEELLPSIVFSLERTAIRDLIVHGRTILTNGQHLQSPEITRRYTVVANRLANKSKPSF
jgi:formimidoylglutamate deiminase